MASLTITVGALNASVAATDQKATALLEQYAASIGATGTAQQRLNAVVASLASHMRDNGVRHRHNVATAEAAAAIQAEIDALTWT
jgi:hypothetical protein